MPDKTPIETHPVQAPARHGGKCPKAVTMRAYEVYCRVFRPQEALVTGGCRSGFGAGELIALLYAHSFPEAEWITRFDEARNGMENL